MQKIAIITLLLALDVVLAYQYPQLEANPYAKSFMEEPEVLLLFKFFAVPLLCVLKYKKEIYDFACKCIYTMLFSVLTWNMFVLLMFKF